MTKPEITTLNASQLIVDPDVQRRLDGHRVEQMAAAYDPEAVGVLTVSRRTNGSYHVVDGQHRHAAARLAQGERATLTCRVFVGLDAAAEARLFRLLNSTKKPQAIDLFRVRIIEGDPVATNIDRVIQGAGWRIAMTPGSFTAVAAADRIYRLSPVAMERSITTITKAWGHDEVDGRIFEGLGMFFARYGNAVDLVALTEKLGVFPGGQRALLGKARALSELLSTTVVRAVAETTVGIYNSRRKVGLLPEWRS